MNDGFLIVEDIWWYRAESC